MKGRYHVCSRCRLRPSPPGRRIRLRPDQPHGLPARPRHRACPMTRFVETVASDVEVNDHLIMNGSGIAGRVLAVKESRVNPAVLLFTIEGFENQHGNPPFSSHRSTRHYVETDRPASR